jgi:short-subunit dehydrogenase
MAISLLAPYENQSIIITGSASGIGLEMARQLSQVSCNLYLLDINETDTSEFESNAKCSVYAVDVNDRSKMVSISEEILAKDSIDLVIANAGVGGVNPADDFSFDVFDKKVNVNINGFVNSIVPYIDSMKKKMCGKLVVISSMAAFRGLPNASSYSASKNFQRIFMESFRVDLKKYNIKCLSIHPGFIKTPMTDHDVFDMPFIITAEKCASKILTAIIKNKSIYQFPFALKLLTYVNRVLPTCLYDLIIPIAAKSKQEKVKPQIF